MYYSISCTCTCIPTSFFIYIWCILLSQQLENEINLFKPKVLHLQAVKKELGANDKVGKKETIEEEMTQLECDWSLIGNVTKCSLENLWVEHEEWLREQLAIMTDYMREGDGLWDVKVEFVNGYPLKRLLESSSDELLTQVKVLTTDHEVMILFQYLDVNLKTNNYIIN